MAKIIFVQNSWFEYHGVEILSAVLKINGHICDLVMVTDERTQNAAIHYIKKEKHQLVAFSISSVQNKWAFDFANIIKKHTDVFTIFGGPHPTFFPQMIEDSNIDIICIGEGEDALVELCNAFDSKGDITKIKNLWIKVNGEIFRNEIRNFIADLDALPFQDRKIYYKDEFTRQFPVKRFLAGRGCPYNCSFCYNHKLKDIYKGKGKYIRTRSPEHIISEIKYVQSQYGVKLAAFTDDTFTLNKKWLLKFLDKYKKEVSIPFTCFGKANNLDEDVVRALKESGCHMICFAIESGNEKIRNEILRKNLTNDKIIETARLLKKYKLKFFTFNMIGLPTETIDQAFETVALNAQIGTDVPYITLFQPMFGTDIYKLSLEKGLLSDLFANNMEKYFFFGDSTPLKQTDSEYLPRLVKLFYFACKVPILNPIIRKLIYVPFGRIYNVIFNIGFFVQEKMKLNLTLWEAIKIAWYLRKKTGSERA